MSKSKHCFSFYKIIAALLFFSYMCFLLSPLQIYAQAPSEKGLPFITNYSTKLSDNSQVWSIQEDERGILYFGIQKYLLEYDGVKWRKITIKNNGESSAIRSMAKNKDGLIYYGAFGDVGYLNYDSLGQKQTYSFRDFIPAANLDFLDVWTTHATESSIYFQSREYIFRLDDKKPGAKKQDMMKVWKPKTKFMYAFYLDGNYYVHQQGLGLYKMEYDSLVLIPGSEFLGKERMQVMLPYKTAGNEKQYLVGLFYSGLYLFNGKTFQPFASQADPVIKAGAVLYKGLQLRNGSYALSTAGKGIVIIDAQGNLLQKINRDVGLQGESIYVPYEDKNGTLWLGMDNGISRVEIASPLTKFALQSGINTSVLSITRFQDNLYIGTSNGLLAFDKATSFFNPVPGIPLSQVFALYPNGNQLLVPGDGLFSVKDKKSVTMRSSISGDLLLTSLSVPGKFPSILLGGGSFGVAVFNKTEVDGFNFAGYIPGITDQIWSFGENKDGTIWAGTQAGLAYRITVAIDEKGGIDFKKTSFKKYGIEQGYKKGLGQVYTIKGINYFIADSSLYSFDDKTKRFIPDTTFGHFSNGGGNTEFEMVEDEQGRVWIRFSKELRIAYPKPAGGYRFDNTLLSSINELSIGVIFTEKNGIVWLGTTDGLIRYDENIKNNNDKSFKTILRFASAGKNALNTIINTGDKPVAVTYKNNSLRFEYAAPFFEQEEKTTYQTWLEGFEKDWSAFDNNYYKEYTNLPPGDYHFHVRAKNIYQTVSEEAVYHFSIYPAWYLTWWAYMLYAFAALAILYTIVKWRTQQLHEKHRELEKTVAERTVQLSQRAEELAVINSVQEGLVREMDMEGIYELVGEKIREIFDAQVIDIVTYDKATNLVEDKYAFEKGDRTLLKPRTAKGFRKHVIDTRVLILANENVEKISREYDNELLIGEMPKSMVLVPMIVGEEVKGIISLQHMDKEHAFTDADVNLLTTLANSMSVALENARLFDETSRLLKETEQRTAELAIINSVQEGLAKELKMQGIYDLVGEKIREIFDAQVIDIVTYDAGKNLIEDQYAFEKGDRTLIGPREPKGFRKYVIDTAQLLLHNSDVEQATRDFNNPVLIGEMPKSQVFVPMIAGGEVKGIISLQNLDNENAFSPSDISLLTTLSNSMSVALESARLFDETNRLLKETEQRTAELAVINSVQEGLAKELDMQAIYELVGNKIQKVFNAQAVLICTLDHEKKMEYFNYAIEKEEISYPAPRPYDKLREYLIESKEKIYINDHNETTAAKYNMKVLPGTELPKSLLFVPLISGDKVRSYVSLQNIDSANAFSESDVRLLETLANSMSVALENARLFDETNRLLKETEQRTAELAVINSVQDGLAKELDMQGIYDMVGDRVQQLFQTHAVIIASLDLVNGIEHFNYVFENGQKYKLEDRPFNKLREKLIEKKQTIYIETEDIARNEFGITAIGDTKMPRSLMFVPLLSGNNIKGYVSIQNIEKENAFNETDIRLLETLANSMSVALENARLFDETNRLLKETEMRQEELATINIVQEELVREMNTKAIYTLVGNKICELFDSQTLVIRTFGHDTGLEYYQYAIEKGTHLTIDPRPIIWANKQLIQTKQSLLINRNYVETAKKFGGTGVGKGLPPKSALFVPMIVGDVVKGSVSLQNVDREDAFNEADLRILTTLTNSMSVAIENARLFDETTHLLGEAKQRAAELGTVNSISKALASQLNADDLIKLVGDQLKELFRANIVYLALLNPKTKIISFPYQYGDDMVPMKLGEGLTSKIILTGEPLLMNKDVTELTVQLGLQNIGLPSASYLGVPIPVGDENIGVLSVQSTEHENRFNENDLRLLSTIASSVGVALNNATLFEDVKVAKMQAEAASKQAEKANEAKSAFLSTVSHELRTPLTSVLGFAKIIKKRLEERIFPAVDTSDAKIAKTVTQVSENLQVVISEGERLTHLINDVLDLAKIEAGKMDFNQENVSMPEVAERAIAATSSLFDQKALKLIRKIDLNVPEIIGDKDKLIQVMINLISNSVKFTDTGSITCSVYQQNDELIASITDTGIGIAPEDFGAVFEQFKQVGGDTLTDKPKGTGLGLPICKEIVEHLGGRIWLESEPGKGSVFSFALPLQKAAKARPIHLDDLVKQLKEQVAHTTLLNQHIAAPHILVVDDDDSIRSLLQQELGDAGYHIEEASNGKEALEKVRNKRPDLIILDIMMPEMNGFDVAAILKNDPQTMDIPIIVLSVVQDKARGFRIGIDRYLNKPIDTTLLFSEIGSLLEQGKSKKKVMIVDEDSGAVNTLTEVLQAKGYEVMESSEQELMEKAVANLPDIIIISAGLSGKQDIVKTLRFEKGLENVLFVVYQ